MKIRDIRIHRLIGGTVDGGWPEGHQPEDDLHTLVEVMADDGLTGVGSVFTNSALVAAGVETLRPLWLTESAIEPQRVSEKLRQSVFWQGRGGTLEHVISGIDIALWDLFGKVCGQPDTTKCGGLTEALRIAWTASDHRVQFVSHGWNTAIGLGADLHLAAALPVARYVEFLTPAPYIDSLLVEPFELDAEGFLTIPDRPGLGIELDRDLLARFSG